MAIVVRNVEVPVERMEVSVYVVPTDEPESDGTLEWTHTTMVLVEVTAAGRRGLGNTYGDAGAARVIERTLGPVVQHRDAMAIMDAWMAMAQAVRNAGRPGIAATAIAAVDAALWDLKAKLLDLPLVTLLGAARSAVPVYGSGGFTSYSPERLAQQLGGWALDGITRVKMKVGRRPQDDVARVRAARAAIGRDAELFVDANGAYTAKQALAFAHAFADCSVTWFEEPVSSDDLEGLRLLRRRMPPGMDVAAGEYGYDLFYFRRMLEAGAVDVLQADATRCMGISGFLAVAALCQAHAIPLSSHTAPALHLHVCCAAPGLRHLEWFHDHVRIEHELFEGAADPKGGLLRPDLSRPGLGLELRRGDAQRYAAA